MSTDASVAMKVEDNLSAAVVSMRNCMTAFRGDVKSLQGELDRLNATRVQMKMDLTGAQREAKQAQKAFEALGDSATEAERQAARANWQQAEENLTNIRQQYELVGRQVRQTTRDFDNASGAISRANNRTAVSGASDLLTSLGKAGLHNMAGDAAGQWANTLVGSAFGSDVGSLFGSALSGAGNGAAIGTMIGGPGIGTLVGGLLGGGVGLLSGASQVYEAQDDAFKAYYSGVYDGQSQAVQEGAMSGSGTAAQRELDAIAFNKLITGGEGGSAFLEDLAAMAAKTPFEYSDLTGMSRNLAIGFGDDPQRILDLMKGIGNAGATVSASAADMSWMATALSRMQSTDLAQLGEINMFQDRGVDVIGMLSSHYGKSEGDIRSMISHGDIGGRDAVAIIQDGLSMYSGAMDTMSQTFEGLSSTLSDTMTEIYNASGESYNASRSEAMALEIEEYGGSLGEALKEAYSAIGAGQAALENLGEAYTRDALSAVLEGGELTQEWDQSSAAQLAALSEEYQAAMAEYKAGNDEAGVKMDSIITAAEGLAQEQFEASELYQADLDAQAESLSALRENTAALRASTGIYSLNQERTKGGHRLGSGNWYPYNVAYVPALSNAYGLNRVPYNNYLSLLHEGERVLTAREAREQDRKSSGIHVTITGNSFGGNVTAEDIAEKFADALARKLAAGVK